jgi:soluble lytic murein transglycosylase-like protein
MAFDAPTAALGLSTPYEDAIRAGSAGDWTLYALIKATIAAESGWNPGAINPSDPSYGLMQVTPTTARFYAPAITPDDLLDPYTNIVIGSAYLRDLYRTHTLPDAVAMYNSGKARKNAQNQYVNSAGSTQVQSYVDAVLTYLDYYMNRLPSQTPAGVFQNGTPEPGVVDVWLNALFGAPAPEPASEMAPTEDLGIGAGVGLLLLAGALALTR